MASVKDFLPGTIVLLRNRDCSETSRRIYGEVVRVQGRTCFVKLSTGKVYGYDCTRLILVQESPPGLTHEQKTFIDLLSQKGLKLVLSSHTSGVTSISEDALNYLRSKLNV